VRTRLTLDRVQSILKYDPMTGIFHWLQSNNGRVGQQAGHLDTKGHRQIEILSVPYSAHRLAWFYMTGQWPKHQIDHINGINDDNRFINLREATNVQNCWNGKIRSHSKSGFKGVHRDGNKWTVRLRLAGELKYYGCFNNLSDAIACSNFNIAYEHGPFARLNKMRAEWSHD
jgi:hypothetical protein